MNARALKDAIHSQRDSINHSQHWIALSALHSGSSNSWGDAQVLGWHCAFGANAFQPDCRQWRTRM